MKKIALTLLMVFFLPITSAFAVKVVSLYQAEIPVATQSSEAKEQAVREGFLQVLIKLSGNSQVDKNPMIQTNLNRADYYVHDYSYLSETPDSSQYLLQITYEPTDVKRLLNNAKVSYWGDHRPLVLVWLVVANKDHGFDIVSEETQGKVFASIKQASQAYGLPLIFPVMDVEEMSRVSPDDVSEISMDVLKDAAKRYSPDALLIGEIAENEQGVQSKWQLVMNDTQFDWKIEDRTTDIVISSIVNQLNHALMGQVAVKNDEKSKNAANLNISG